MKNKMIAIAGAALMTLVLAQTVQAITMTGNIGFGGSGFLDNAALGSANQVTTWQLQQVNSAPSGSFAGWVSTGATVTMAPGAWNFTSGPIANFWTVNGFIFDLTSSSVFSQNNTALTVLVAGTVSGNGFSSTAFTGSLNIGTPPIGTDPVNFNTQLQFGAQVPDGGATVMLLGIALSGVGLLRKKLAA